MRLVVDALRLLRVRADGLFVVDAASVDAVNGDGDDGDGEDEEKETQERRSPQ